MPRMAPEPTTGPTRAALDAADQKAKQEARMAAIEAGGSTLRDYARPDGELGYFAKQWRVYGREGETCPCGGIVRRRTDGGRSTFYCADCQR